MTTAGRALLLTEVAAAGDSLDENLRAKVESLLQKLSTDDKGKPDAKSSTTAAQDAEALAAQKLNAEVGTKIAEGRRLHETDPDKAIALYEQTVQAVQAAGLSPDLTRPMVRRLEVAIELAKKDKVEFERKMQDKQLRAEIETKRLRILEADKAKKARMKDLMDKAMKAYAEGNYVECEAFAKRAMEVDPNELAASMLVYKAKTERRFKQDQLNRNNKEEANVTAFQAVDLAAIADPEVQLRDIKFPKNFKDLTRDRLAMNAKLEPKKDPKVLTIEAKLKDRISMNMDKQPLSEAVTFLQNYTGLNIVLDPKALGEEGLTSASPVSLVVNQIQLKTALKLMLRPLGLTYKVEDEVVLITSPQATQSQTYPQTYYVGDLVMPPDHGATEHVAAYRDGPESRPQSDPNAGGIQTQGVFGAARSEIRTVPRRESGPPRASGPQVDMMPLIQLITTSIAPGTWRVQDGYGHDVSSAYGMGGGFGGDAGGGLDTQPSARCDRAFLPEHQPDHQAYGGSPRTGRRPAPPAPPAPGPSGFGRSPLHHGQRHLLRADRRRFRLPDPVRHRRQTQYLRDPESGRGDPLARSSSTTTTTHRPRPRRRHRPVGTGGGSSGGGTTGGGDGGGSAARAARRRQRRAAASCGRRLGSGGRLGPAAAAVRRAEQISTAGLPRQSDPRPYAGQPNAAHRGDPGRRPRELLAEP